jgi:hypothetical protein
MHKVISECLCFVHFVFQMRFFILCHCEAVCTAPVESEAEAISQTTNSHLHCNEPGSSSPSLRGRVHRLVGREAEAISKRQTPIYIAMNPGLPPRHCEAVCTAPVESEAEAISKRQTPIYIAMNPGLPPRHCEAVCTAPVGSEAEAISKRQTPIYIAMNPGLLPVIARPCALPLWRARPKQSPNGKLPSTLQ